MARTIHAPRPASLKQPKPAGRLLKQKYLTPAEVAARIHETCTSKAVRHLARAGELEYIQRSSRCKMFITEESVEAYLERGHHPAHYAPRSLAS